MDRTTSIFLILFLIIIINPVQAVPMRGTGAEKAYYFRYVEQDIDYTISDIQWDEVTKQFNILTTTPKEIDTLDTYYEKTPKKEDKQKTKESTCIYLWMKNSKEKEYLCKHAPKKTEKIKDGFYKDTLHVGPTSTVIEIFYWYESGWFSAVYGYRYNYTISNLESSSIVDGFYNLTLLSPLRTNDRDQYILIDANNTTQRWEIASYSSSSVTFKILVNMSANEERINNYIYFNSTANNSFLQVDADLNIDKSDNITVFPSPLSTIQHVGMMYSAIENGSTFWWYYKFLPETGQKIISSTSQIANSGGVRDNSHAITQLDNDTLISVIAFGGTTESLLVLRSEDQGNTWEDLGDNGVNTGNDGENITSIDIISLDDIRTNMSLIIFTGQSESAASPNYHVLSSFFNSSDGSFSGCDASFCYEEIVIADENITSVSCARQVQDNSADGELWCWGDTQDELDLGASHDSKIYVWNVTINWTVQVNVTIRLETTDAVQSETSNDDYERVFAYRTFDELTAMGTYLFHDFSEQRTDGIVESSSTVGQDWAVSSDNDYILHFQPDSVYNYSITSAIGVEDLFVGGFPEIVYFVYNDTANVFINWTNTLTSESAEIIGYDKVPISSSYWKSAIDFVVYVTAGDDVIFRNFTAGEMTVVAGNGSTYIDTIYSTAIVNTTNIKNDTIHVFYWEVVAGTFVPIDDLHERFGYLNLNGSFVNGSQRTDCVYNNDVFADRIVCNSTSNHTHHIQDFTWRSASNANGRFVLNVEKWQEGKQITELSNQFIIANTGFSVFETVERAAFTLGSCANNLGYRKTFVRWTATDTKGFQDPEVATDTFFVPYDHTFSCTDVMLKEHNMIIWWDRMSEEFWYMNTQVQKYQDFFNVNDTGDDPSSLSEFAPLIRVEKDGNTYAEVYGFQGYVGEGFKQSIADKASRLPNRERRSYSMRRLIDDFGGTMNDLGSDAEVWYCKQTYFLAEWAYNIDYSEERTLCEILSSGLPDELILQIINGSSVFNLKFSIFKVFFREDLGFLNMSDTGFTGFRAGDTTYSISMTNTSNIVSREMGGTPIVRYKLNAFQDPDNSRQCKIELQWPHTASSINYFTFRYGVNNSTFMEYKDIEDTFMQKFRSDISTVQETVFFDLREESCRGEPMAILNIFNYTGLCWTGGCDKNSEGALYGRNVIPLSRERGTFNYDIPFMYLENGISGNIRFNFTLKQWNGTDLSGGIEFNGTNFTGTGTAEVTFPADIGHLRSSFKIWFTDFVETYNVSFELQTFTDTINWSLDTSDPRAPFGYREKGSEMRGYIKQFLNFFEPEKTIKDSVIDAPEFLFNINTSSDITSCSIVYYPLAESGKLSDFVYDSVTKDVPDDQVSERRVIVKSRDLWEFWFDDDFRTCGRYGIELYYLETQEDKDDFLSKVMEGCAFPKKQPFLIPNGATFPLIVQTKLRCTDSSGNTLISETEEVHYDFTYHKPWGVEDFVFWWDDGLVMGQFFWVTFLILLAILFVGPSTIVMLISDRNRSTRRGK